MVLPIALVDDDALFPRRDVRQPRPACFSIFHDMTSLILMAQTFPQRPVRPHVYFCDVDDHRYCSFIIDKMTMLCSSTIKRASRGFALLVISSRFSLGFVHPWVAVQDPTRLASHPNSDDDDCLIPSVDSGSSYSNDHSTSRRHWLRTTSNSILAASAAVGTLSSSPDAAEANASKSRTDGYDVQKSPSEWKSILTQTQYDVLRNGATERPYSSILEGEERAGTYKCAGCGTNLFESKQKFHSGTGWPSFARALDGVEIEDVNAVQANLGGAELRCRTCGGHLGDVFNDGFLFVGSPAFQSGKRFCIDGSALVFQPSNGEAEVIGDKSPPPKAMPSWLEPPSVMPRS